MQAPSAHPICVACGVSAVVCMKSPPESLCPLLRRIAGAARAAGLPRSRQYRAQFATAHRAVLGGVTYHESVARWGLEAKESITVNGERHVLAPELKLAAAHFRAVLALLFSVNGCATCPVCGTPGALAAMFECAYVNLELVLVPFLQKVEGAAKQILWDVACAVQKNLAQPEVVKMLTAIRGCGDRNTSHWSDDVWSACKEAARDDLPSGRLAITALSSLEDLLKFISMQASTGFAWIDPCLEECRDLMTRHSAWVNAWHRAAIWVCNKDTRDSFDNVVCSILIRAAHDPKFQEDLEVADSGVLLELPRLVVRNEDALPVIEAIVGSEVAVLVRQAVQGCKSAPGEMCAATEKGAMLLQRSQPKSWNDFAHCVVQLSGTML